MSDYQEASLWKTAFGDSGLDSQGKRDARNDLLAALRALEDRVKPILASVPESCKGLTIHDISHVHQLWSVASEICGPEFEINPLEGFVLAAAYLIHDAGLTAAAYPGGIDALKQTNYYVDRIATLLRGEQEWQVADEAMASPPPRIAERALFETLRAVHAVRAEKLLENVAVHPLTGQPYPLFENADLFLDCGELIGLIAASHHWPIAKADMAFQEPRTAPARFQWWPIDAAKLACILRAADACAIDERRAHIMSFIITNPQDISRDHWLFQANLNPGRRRDDAMVFNAKRPFSRAQMPAW
jgi:hypothetical protein